MKRSKSVYFGAAIAFAFCTAAAPATAQELVPETGPWHNTVEVTEDGHIVGDPDAETLLTEFVSYTCSHCAHFSKQGDPALDIAFISPGKLRFEIRPFIRNALDLTISMLVACGDPKKFKANHTMFMRSQSDWLPAAASAPRAQQEVWGRGDRAARVNMANSLGLIDQMTKQRGFSVVEVNTCLADDAMAQRLMQNTRDDAGEFGVSATPSFALNGELLPDVHDWGALYPALQTHFEAQEEADSEPQLGESQFNP